jgi:hypothetical protein
MYGMIGVLGALLISMMMTPMLVRVWDFGMSQQQERLAADHLNMVAGAAASYARKHHETLLSSATASGGPTVDVPALVNDGFLSQGFAERNVWGQTYSVYFRQPREHELQSIVLTSGGFSGNGKRNFETTTAPSAALLAGGSAGFVPSGTVPGQTAGTLHGAGGGWVLSLSGVGIPSPGAGHLGALAEFDASALGQDFLYRVGIPGHEELNEMRADMDMTDHAIRNVSELEFTEREITTEACAEEEDQGRMFLDKNIGLYLCRNYRLETIADTGNSALLTEAATAKNGDVINKPVCPVNTGTIPMIFTAPAIAEAGAVAPPLSSFQTWATSLSDTQWRVNLRVQTGNKSIGDDDGWVYPGDNYNRITVFTTCARETL